MKPQTTIKQTAVWDPHKNSIMYFVDGKPVCGFVGNTASRKFVEALANPEIELTINDSSSMEKPKLIKQLHAVMAKKGLLDLKADIIAQYEVTSTKELTEPQLRELIDNLQKQDVRADVRVQRSTVLNLLDKLGIKGSKETGWESVNSYLCSPRIAGKPLYELTYTELQEVEKKLRVIIYKVNNLKIK